MSTEAAGWVEDELDQACASIARICPSGVDLAALRDLYAATAHKSHKDWPATEEAAQGLSRIVGGPDDDAFGQIFKRVLDDGCWKTGEAAAASRQENAEFKPWVVLVTGLNGIRKTTSVHQPWFKQALQEALGSQFAGDADELPSGKDSFFRQLDYMIATLALTEFEKLYAIKDVATYSAEKARIFTRYRTIAEMLGVLLVKEARRRRMNIMVETSGRDIGMFHYIEHLFPDEEYRKLVINFAINDLSFAEASVDTRMEREMRDGQKALETASSDPLAIVRANAGGPYGSAVLAGVQADSQRVWQSVISGGEDVGATWLKASIAITADAAAPWTARAVGASESSTVFEFVPP